MNGSGDRFPDKLPRQRQIIIAWLIGAQIGIVGILLVILAPHQEVLSEQPRGNEARVSFVKSTTCAECHPQQYQEWSGSHHGQAMQHANEKTVLGDFNDTSFTHFGVTSRFFKKDGKFFVNTEGPDGKLADFEIKYTFGIEPLQQYLIEFPGGRLQSLTIAWNTEKKRWFHLYPNEKIASEDPLHWTGRYQNWNLMCAECHTTHLRKGYDLKTDSYQTAWDEINVSCQACHGPGEAHVKWAHTQQNHKAPKQDDKGLLVNFKMNDSRYQVETCAPCHSRRHRISGEYRHSSPFLDDFVPSLLNADLYHADGQILGEVYEYGSFLQSQMYRQGVRCTDCHNPHNLKLKAEGNTLCIQCHQEHPDPRFPTLSAKNYDTPTHHFHPTGSPGAQCVNCHMPNKTYMVVDPRRDHSFRVPRPDLSTKLSTSNVCSTCHTDKSAQWAAEMVEKWYGSKRQQEPHYAEVISAGRAGIPEAESRLIQLAEDTQQSAMVRATALELLRPYSPKSLDAMVRATQDENPLVRVTAVGGLDRLPPKQRLVVVMPLLKDPIRAVRIEAVRVLASVPSDVFDPSQRPAFETALTEYREAQMAMADMPSSHLNLGVLQTNLGQPDLAEQSYQIAIRMDPYFLPARFNLANLYNQMNRNGEAERVLRDGIQHVPNQGELYYSLGLLLAEERRLEEAAGELGKAAELLPHRARVRYNYALALQHLGRRAEAETALLQAYQTDSRDPGIVHALAIFYAQQQQWERALPYAQKLIELAPGEPGPRQLMQQIQERVRP
jgi:predicted CXXCH cytochrome family protein